MVMKKKEATKVYSLKKEQQRAAAVMMTPLLITLILLFLLPVLLVLIMSFTNWSMTTTTRSYVGFRNFLFVLNDCRFWNAFGNTLFYTGIKLVADTGLALFIAVLLDKKIHFRRFFRIAHFAPVVVPITASSLIWLWFYDPGIGPLNQILSWLGLPSMQWLYSEKTALLSVILFSVWKGLGYNVILFLAGLQSIPESYLEAARIDGASERQVFRKVKLPLLAPITSFIVMMGIINCFKVFTEVDVMTPNHGPLESTLLMVSYIYDQSFTRGKMGRGAAAAIILFLIIFVFTMLQRRLGRKEVSFD
ncbi:Binding-protein-dependent transport systems inner membrane component [uncultured spirochete]|uniref:Binding-protein-dependent transport systems inner membrane component n=1 Tax=uncultured spirochete TaxID=156406 RepID=A0A3P3XS94_9SPIR|nr:Binding-protein-dependent transport systems inner membrane component [uncultured spirochete]